MRRSLIHHWRTHLAVVLGAAVTTAVLTGALLVGDSLRGSLRDLTLDRLGEVEWAVVAERPFRASLAADLAPATTRGALTLRASASDPASGTRASNVALWGVGPDIATLLPDLAGIDLAARRGAFPAAAVSQALASELGVVAGADVVLAFQRPSDVPRETVVGRADSSATLEVLRLTVASVLPHRGAGGFALEPRQARAFNVFVDLERLQRSVLGRDDDRINVVLGAGSEPGSRLDSRLRLEDFGLRVHERAGALTVDSRSLVLDDVVADSVLDAGRALGGAVQPVLTYLANTIAIGDRSLPYSTIAALDPPAAPGLGDFRQIDGSPAPALREDEILLNEWAAEDLAATPGDAVDIAYYELGPRDELTTVHRTLRLRGVVALAGLAADRHLTPELPGLSQAEDIAAWDPPFPVDLARIRPVDEAYWDLHRATPKAFVSLALGQELWRSRFGGLTAVRLAPAAGGDASTLAAALDEALRRRLDATSAGLRVRPLRQEGLRAARGATDFAGLFLGLSLFLIVSAALLAGLLFRLGVERRASEVGLLRALGFPARAVRRRFLAEGAVLAALGALLGVGGGIGYAGGLVAGLRSWWLPAIGEPVLFLHVVPATLGLGAAISLAVVLSAIAMALRRLRQVPIVALLAGVATVEQRAPGRWPRRAAWIGLIAAVGLLAAAPSAGAQGGAALTLGAGAALLVAGLAGFAHWSARPARRAQALGARGGTGMAVRNSARNRSRSLLCVALMASACFVLVVVAAQRVERQVDVTDPASGAGGFSLVAETDVAIPGDLADESPEAAAALGGARAIPFRLRPGEDVSCLNLYRPERPRILGAPSEMIERGGFGFRQSIAPRDNPWRLLEEPLPDGAIPAIGDYNSVLWILHSGLGEDLVVEGEGGRPATLRLVALLDTSLFQSEIIVSERAFERLFPSRAGYSFFLLDPAPRRAATVAASLESELARLGFDATDTRRRLAAFRAVEDTYLTTFQTLGGLGLVLGTIGMGIVLLRNVLERRSELATLAAMGYRRARLRALVLLENAFLLLLGLAVGGVAGLVAAAPQLLAAGRHLPWASLAAVLAGVLLAGLAASALALRAIARLPLLESLRAT